MANNIDARLLWRSALPMFRLMCRYYIRIDIISLRDTARLPSRHRISAGLAGYYFCHDFHHFSRRRRAYLTLNVPVNSSARG